MQQSKLMQTLSPESDLIAPHTGFGFELELDGGQKAMLRSNRPSFTLPRRSFVVFSLVILLL